MHTVQLAVDIRTYKILYEFVANYIGNEPMSNNNKKLYHQQLSFYSLLKYYSYSK